MDIKNSDIEYFVSTSQRLVRSAKLKPQEKVLYQLLLSYGEKAFPSHETLAIGMGYSPKSTSSVKKWLKRLKEKKLIIEWHKRDFRGTNQYTIHKFKLGKTGITNQPQTRLIAHNNKPHMNPSISLNETSVSGSAESMSNNKFSDNKISNNHQERIDELKTILPLGDNFYHELVNKFPNKNIGEVVQKVKLQILSGKEIQNVNGYILKVVENQQEDFDENFFKPGVEELKAKELAREHRHDGAYQNFPYYCDLCSSCIPKEVLKYSQMVIKRILSYENVSIDNWISSKEATNENLDSQKAYFIQKLISKKGEEAKLCYSCTSLIC